MENKYVCPNCGHIFEQGEYEYDYDLGKLVFYCPDCDHSGCDIIDNSKVENDLYDRLSERDLDCVEVTDEDVSNVFTQMEKFGDSYEDAIKSVVEGIEKCIG